jgi:hypothetical protein
MPHVDLPRALEDYFAHAETAPTRDGRRFSITLPYLQGAKLDSLQWWWSIGSVQLQLIGDEGFAAQRRSAIEKFSRHIERWLVNNDQRLHGDGPIPRLEALPKPAPLPQEPAVDVAVATPCRLSA